MFTVVCLLSEDVTNRFDRVFWFGDFNFRIQKPRAYVDKMLKKHSQNDESLIGELMQHDQLNELFVKGKIFHGFTESPIHFMPTYKFDVNTAVYDTSSKQRVPSWTVSSLRETKFKVLNIWQNLLLRCKISYSVLFLFLVLQTVNLT